MKLLRELYERGYSWKKAKKGGGFYAIVSNKQAREIIDILALVPSAPLHTGSYAYPKDMESTYQSRVNDWHDVEVVRVNRDKHAVVVPDEDTTDIVDSETFNMR